jgi:hypothetical protein
MPTPPATPGGRRPGAGRKPDVFKRLFDNAAKKIVTQEKMDQLVQSLIDQAIEGDTRAAVALLDRLLGKAPQPITGEDGEALKVIVQYEGKASGASLPASGPDTDSF